MKWFGSRLDAAWKALEANDLGGAEARALDVLQKEPANVSALDCLGRVKALKGEWDKAAFCYQKAVAENPDDGDLHRRMAEARGMLGDLAGGVESLLHAAAHRPAAEQEQLWRTAHDWMPGDERPLAHLARLYRSSGRAVEAADCERRLRALDPFATVGD